MGKIFEKKKTKPKKLTAGPDHVPPAGHLGCGTDRSWYVASAFRLAWTWFGVKGEGVTLSGCFKTPELEHTPKRNFYQVGYLKGFLS